jgi:hypothetical protein
MSDRHVISGNTLLYTASNGLFAMCVLGLGFRLVLELGLGFAMCVLGLGLGFRLGLELGLGFAMCVCVPVILSGLGLPITARC